jgi:alpha-galactosidase
MTDEMLVAQAKWLPQYRTQIAPAKRRLAAHETAGTRVKLRKTTGAARLKTKSVKEMKADSASAAANAAAADKGKMTR